VVPPYMSPLGHGRPNRLRDWHARSYVNCGRPKTKGRHSGLGPGRDILIGASARLPLYLELV
jgi:hypothetical protein